MSKKKKILLISIISAVVLAGVITLIVCLSIKAKNKNKDKVTDIEVVEATSHLEKPLNLSVKDDILTWNSVNNADSYLVYVNDLQYVVNEAKYSLAECTDNRLTLSVVAKASAYLDSVKSVEIIYVKKVDSEETTKINSMLSSFFTNRGIELSSEEKDALASKLYLDGLTSTDAYNLLNNVLEVLNNLDKLENVDKRDITTELVNSLSSLYEEDINSVSLISALRDIFALYLTKEVSSLSVSKTLRKKVKVTYYDTESLINAYSKTIENLNGLSNLSIQNIASTINYLHLFEKEGKNIIDTLAGSSLLDDTFYNDLITLKDAINDLLLISMPLKVEYDDALNNLSALYNGIAYKYLTEEVKSSDLEAILIKGYSEIHYILSFLNTLTKDDIKYITSHAKDIYKSIDEDKRADIEKTLNNIPNFGLVITYFSDKVKDNIKALSISDEFISKIKECFEQDDIIAALDEYLSISTYLNVTEEDLDVISDYFVGLLPEENQSDVPSFIEEVLSEIKYENFIEFEQERFLNDLDFEKVMNAVLASGDGIVAVLDSLDVVSYLKINRAKLIEEIKRVISLKAPNFDTFNKETKGMSFEELKEKIGLRSAFNLDFAGLFNHIIDLSGLNVTEESYKVFEKSIEDTYDYILDMYPAIGVIPSLITMIDSFSNMESIEDISEEQAMDLMNSLTDLGFDYLSVYSLNNYLKTKYAKFLAKYKAPYPNGRDIDQNIHKNVLLKGGCYYLFGVDAYYMDDIVVDVFNISVKLVKMLFNAKTYYDYAIHYIDLYNSYDGIDLSIFNLSSEEFNEQMDKFDEEIYYAYNVIKDLRTSFIIDESFVLVDDIAELINAKDYEFASKVIRFFNELAEIVYDNINLYIDDVMDDYNDKSLAIRDFYATSHEIADPIVEFIDKTKKRYEGIEGEALYESLSIYLVQNSYNIIGFYQRDKVEQLGDDLSNIFEETGYDFASLTTDVCDYLDRLVERMDDPMFFPNLINDVKVIVRLIDVLSTQEQIIEEDVNNINEIQDAELINIVALDDAYRKLIADLRYTYDETKDDILSVSSSIDYMFETNFYDLFDKVLNAEDYLIDTLNDSLPDINALEQAYIDELKEQFAERFDVSNVIDDIRSEITEFFESIDLSYFVEIYENIIDTLYDLYQKYFG